MGVGRRLPPASRGTLRRGSCCRAGRPRPSGWYCTLEHRQVAVAASPSQVSSFKLRWRGPPRPPGRVFGSTAKPWFCVVISTRLLQFVEHRLIRPPVAELQLEGASSERLTEQLVPEGRCRRSASCRAAPFTAVHGVAECGGGRRDRLLRKMPSGRSARNLLGAPRPRDDRDLASHLHEASAGCSTSCRNPRRRTCLVIGRAGQHMLRGAYRSRDPRRRTSRGRLPSRSPCRPCSRGPSPWPRAEASSRSTLDSTPAHRAARAQDAARAPGCRSPSMPVTPLAFR